MKITFVLNNLGAGGAERVVCNLSDKLVERGYNISIITARESNQFYEINPKIDIESCYNKGGNKIIRFLNLIIDLRKKIKESNSDIIVSFISVVNIYSILANAFRKTPIIISERNNPYMYPSELYFRVLRKLLYNFSDGFVFQTSDAKEYFNKRIQTKSIIIQNPVVLNVAEKNDCIRRENIIVSVGRLDKQKNHKMLIDAFSKICMEFENYSLIIYGEGNEREKLEEYIEGKNLNNRIKLPGTSNQIHNQIKNASLFVLSSNFEGMPNALMEAMALGIPCISTDCPIGGPKELITHEENGLLVPVGNSEILSESIARLLSDKGLSERLSKNAMEIFETNSLDNITKLWESYISKVIKTKLMQ